MKFLISITPGHWSDSCLCTVGFSVPTLRTRLHRALAGHPRGTAGVDLSYPGGSPGCDRASRHRLRLPRAPRAPDGACRAFRWTHSLGGRRSCSTRTERWGIVASDRAARRAEIRGHRSGAVARSGLPRDRGAGRTSKQAPDASPEPRRSPDRGPRPSVAAESDALEIDFRPTRHSGESASLKSNLCRVALVTRELAP
jgi:hypothetical protein